MKGAKNTSMTEDLLLNLYTKFYQAYEVHDFKSGDRTSPDLLVSIYNGNVKYKRLGLMLRFNHPRISSTRTKHANSIVLVLLSHYSHMRLYSSKKMKFIKKIAVERLFLLYTIFVWKQDTPLGKVL